MTRNLYRGFFTICVFIALALRAGNAQDGSVQPPPDQRSVADIIAEVEAMKRRLEQLEAVLAWKEQAAKDQERASRAVQVASPGSPPAGGPAAQLTSPAVQVKPASDATTPFAFADFTWLNGVPRNHDEVLDSKYFTGEFRADTSYIHDYNHPIDHSLAGTTEGARTGEVQVQHLGVGGDFHAGSMQGRVLTQFGIYSTSTPRNDASPSVGQWNLADAYRYITEAWGGYHMDVQHGLNIQAGIFLSYIGLFSYYNFDNWAYQPSYVSSNTPWFFNGARVQWFPNNKLKIEPWFVNGWQSYGKFNGKFNGRPGVGGQILWRPTGNLDFVFNSYALSQDTVGRHRTRYHEDDSIQWRYYENLSNPVNRMAFSFTWDCGCESGAGVTCTGGKGGPAQNFLGFMFYNRWWFHHERFAATIGGGAMENPGRYLVLLPPINGATASTERRISPRIQVTGSRPGTPKGLSITCQASSLPFESNLLTGQPTSPTSPAREALHLPEGTSESSLRLFRDGSRISANGKADGSLLYW